MVTRYHEAGVCRRVSLRAHAARSRERAGSVVNRAGRRGNNRSLLNRGRSTMAPILVTFEAVGLTVRGWHTAIAVAVVICFLVGPPLAKRLEGLPPNATRGALALMGVAAFVGGRFHYVAENWRVFFYDPLRVVEPWFGGILAPG